jgi:CAAX prenyl protease-like protein
LWLVRDSLTKLKWEWSWWAVVGGWAVFWLWLIVERPYTATDSNRQMAKSLGDLPHGWADVWVAFRVAGSVVTVPLAEELAFRGYVSRRLIAADFERVPFGRLTWFSFLVSSVLFGAFHDRWLAGTMAGMLYALILARRGRFSDAVLAHATTNALIAIYVLVTGEWSLWS